MNKTLPVTPFIKKIILLQSDGNSTNVLFIQSLCSAYWPDIHHYHYKGQPAALTSNIHFHI